MSELEAPGSGMLMAYVQDGPRQFILKITL